MVFAPPERFRRRKAAGGPMGFGPRLVFLFINGQEFYMSRVCHFTGKRTVAGRSIARRGKAKYLGGVGRNVTGVTKRKFKPNIQKVRAVVDGKVVRIKASAKAIRNGMVVKPARRDYQPAEAEKA